MSVQAACCSQQHQLMRASEAHVSPTPAHDFTLEAWSVYIMKICERDKSGHFSSSLTELVVKHLPIHHYLCLFIIQSNIYSVQRKKNLDSPINLTLDLFSLLLKVLQLLHKYFFLLLIYGFLKFILLHNRNYPKILN